MATAATDQGPPAGGRYATIHPIMNDIFGQRGGLRWDFLVTKIKGQPFKDQGYFYVPGDSNENKPMVGAEEEEVAKMGCPSLGEHTQIEVVIEESYEFKVSQTADRLNFRHRPAPPLILISAISLFLGVCVCAESHK